MSILVQTSPFLGQVVLDNGEIHVIDKLIGEFTLYNSSNGKLGSVSVKEQEDNTKSIALYDCNNVERNTYLITETKFTKGNLGCQLWLGSLAFTIWSQQLEGNIGSVLELGCGVGLCGIHCALFASSVVLTDGFPCLKDTVQRNIEQNKSNTCIKFETLDWQEKPSKFIEYKFNTIVATDCIYTDNIEPLLDTMLRYISKDGKIYIINTAPEYRKGVDEFLTRLNTVKNINVKTENITLSYNNKFNAKFIVITICMSF